MTHRLSRVDDYKNQIGISQGLFGLFDANAFGFVLGAADARGVDQFDGNSTQRNRFADQVAGGAGLGGDDGALLLQQSIKQAGFADVGTAHDGQGQALMNDLAVTETGGELQKRSSNLRNAIADGGIRSDGNIVFGEVDSGFEQRDQFDELALDGFEAIGERAFQL